MGETISKLAILLTANTAPFGTGLATAGTQLTGFQSVVDGVGASLDGIAIKLATAAAALVGIGLGWGVKLAADAEQAQVAIATMTGSAETAKTLLAELTKFAAETPFESPELQSAAKQLLAYGTTVGEIVPTLRMLGDVASGVGAPLNDLVYLYGTARQQTALHQQDINQLTNRGIPIVKELAKAFGVSTGEIRTMTEAGKIGFADLQNAFVDMTSKGGQYFNMTKNQSETLSGIFSTLKDNAGLSLKAISESLLKELNVKDNMKSLIDWIEDFGKRATAMATVVIRWVKQHWELIATVTKLTALIGGTVYAISKFIKIGGAVIGIIQAISKAQVVALALSGPKGWAQLAIGAGIAAVAIGGVASVYGGISAEADKLVTQSDALTKAQTGVAESAGKIDTAASLAKQKQDQLAGGISTLTKKLQESVDTFGMSANQIELWKLQQQGATEAQLAGATALSQQLDQLESQKKAMEELTAAAKKWHDAIATPGEKLTAQLEEIDRLQQKNLLTADEAQRAAQKASDDAYGKTKLDKAPKDERTTGIERLEALERRFTSGFSAEIASSKWQDKLIKEQARTAKAAERTAKNTDGLNNSNAVFVNP